MENSNTLFRYRVVNKNSIDSLMKDTLYATTPDNFNDKYLILSICKEKNLPVYQMYSSYSHRNFGLHAKMYTSEEIDKILKEFSN